MAVLIIILLVAFALDNSTVVLISFWFWQIESSLATIIFICLGVGIVTGTAFNIPSQFAKRKTISKLRKEIKWLEKERLQQPEKFEFSENDSQKVETDDEEKLN